MSIFSKVSLRRPKRNLFDLSHERKMSLNMGDLIPMFLTEVVPGDTFKVRAEIMMRMAPILAPIMHRVNVTSHYFFVPNRLIWSEWEDFITGGKDGTLEPIMPYIVWNSDRDNCLEASLADYLGLPPFYVEQNTGGVKISTLPFRAYALIYNEYYRDQNLTDPAEISFASGLETQTDHITVIRKRTWEKDYFTSCLPFAQRGNPVSVPASVDYLSQGIAINTTGAPITGQLADKIILDNLGGINRSDDGTVVSQQMNIQNIDEIQVNINDLRISARLQEWLEKNARGGARYIEQILSHFGVLSSDARLQRPEYLGGGMQPMVISEVLSTVGTTATGIEAPQGNMSGHGISVGGSNGFKKSFEEHGYIMGIMSVTPRTAYQNGIERSWLRQTKEDFYWPEFANLGEQSVYNVEVFNDGSDTEANLLDTFGYQSRYAEYKYKQSSVHGAFRSTLDYWHMGRKFDTAPSLNSAFVDADPTSRVFAVTEGTEKLYCQIFHNVKAIRPMPYFGTPRL